MIETIFKKIYEYHLYKKTENEKKLINGRMIQLEKRGNLQEQIKACSMVYNMERCMQFFSPQGLEVPPRNIVYFVYMAAILSDDTTTAEELAQLFGYCIRFKADYYKVHPKKRKEIGEKLPEDESEIDLCTKISHYFNQEGEILPIKDEETLRLCLEDLLSSFLITIPKDSAYDTSIVLIKALIDLMLDQLTTINAIEKDKKENLETRTKESGTKTNVLKVPTFVPVKNKKQNALWRELNTYYQNGEIIAMCADLNYFRDLLLALEFPTAEVEAIYRKMEKFLVQASEVETAKYPFSEEEKDLLRRARRNSYKENIKAILADIDVALALFNEEPSCLKDIEPLIEDSLKMLSCALPIENIESMKKSFVN